jgi:hypothetical protein
MSNPVATRPSDEFLKSVEKALAERRSRRAAAPVASAPPVEKPATPEASISGYEQAAAVMAWFEDASIRPIGGKESSELRDRLLTVSVPVTDKDGRKRLTLHPERRIKVLRALREAGRVEAALAANTLPDDPTQEVLRAGLNSAFKPLKEQSLAELATTHEVCGWLRAAGFDGLPPPEALVERTDWLTLLAPFEHLASDGQFRGRVEELRQLRSYAGVQPPGSLRESATRFFEQIFDIKKKPPLVVHGPGGTGKSTLIARFIFEHARALEQERFPFIYLDFDRPEIDAGEPLTLLIEAVRQLGIEYPQARTSLESLRTRWAREIAKQRENISQESASVQSSEQATVTLNNAIHEFGLLVLSLGSINHPVLLVLDTFEEVQWHGDAHVLAIWKLLSRLQVSLPRLRVVVAGRGEVEGWSSATLALTGLDEEAAIGYLRARGIGDEALARRLARQIGGSPLSLKLAAELAQREGLDEKGHLNVSTHEFFFLKVDTAVLQRQLYQRVLNHVHDEGVRKLAHPGLVLRRITPELILKVLAEPCGIAIGSLAEAEELFKKLRRETGLVSSAPDGSLRHIQALRVVMMELLRSDDPDKVRAIHQRAVAYYEQRTPVAAERAEEIYHRLQLDHDFATIETRWMEEAARYLVGALEEFSGRRRAYLASRLGADVDALTRAAADLEDWERLTSRSVADLLAQDQPRRALEMMRARAERSVASPLFALEARTCTRLGEWQNALAAIDRGFASTATGGARNEAFALALQRAETVLAGGLVAEAGRSYEALARVSEGAISQIQRLEAAIRNLALAKVAPELAGKDPGLRGTFEKLFDQMPDGELSGRPGLAHWAAAVFGLPDALRLARVIKLAGLPRPSDGDLRELGAELAAFDAMISKDLAESPGVLARACDIAVARHSSLTAAWSDYLIGRPEAELRRGLEALLRENAVFVQPRVIDAFANLMLAALGIRRATTVETAGLAANTSALVGTAAADIELSGPDILRLRDTLAAAFSVEEIASVLRGRLQRNIESISSISNPAGVIFIDLVRHAAAEGWLPELVVQLQHERPNDREIAAVAEKLGVGGVASGAGLEAIIRSSQGASSDALSVTEFAARLEQIESAICRVEVGSDIMATGFLVGIDLLLTADFALSDVLNKGRPSSDVRLRFDYRQTRRGQSASEGVLFALEPDWLVARDAYDENRGLGYALLRVRGAPGAQPIGGGRGSSQRLRQWLNIEGKPIVAGTPVSILGHVQGRALQLLTGQILGMSTDGKDILYNADTAGGSSGGPCLNKTLDLIGMHLGRNPRTGRKKGDDWSFGVTAAAIYADLERKGLGGLTGRVLA